MRVRVALPDDWAAVRRVRLAALQDAPSAFWSAYADEVGQSEQQWRDRIARGLKLLALDADRVVGHAGGFVPTGRATSSWSPCGWPTGGRWELAMARPLDVAQL